MGLSPKLDSSGLGREAKAAETPMTPLRTEGSTGNRRAPQLSPGATIGHMLCVCVCVCVLSYQCDGRRGRDSIYEAPTV